MALAALKIQLRNFVQSMLDEGVLDSQFSQIQALQDASNPTFVEDVITLFCNDAERIITELNKYLGYDNVDFSKIDSYVHQLKGSSSSIGAGRLKQGCVNLRQASDQQNKEGCLLILNTITCEYFILRNKFHTLIQLERSIIALESNRQ